MTWSSDCSSTGMRSGEPSNRRSTTLKHPQEVEDNLLQHAVQQGATRATGQPGSVTFVPRFGGSITAHVHCHVVFLEGVCVDRTLRASRRVFCPPPPQRPRTSPPSCRRSAGVSSASCARAALSKRTPRPWSPRATTPRATQIPRWPAPWPPAVQQRLACGERAGQQGRCIGSGCGDAGERPTLTGPRCASVNGFSLPANTAIPAHRRDPLERLLRYTARGAVALERLEVNADGDLLDTCTHPWSAGTTGITRSPWRCWSSSRLVPLPRQHQGRYGGCLAPQSHLRATILPTPRQQGREAPADRSPSPHWTWARLLKRVFALDMARCPVWQQGRLRIIAAITAGHVIQKMLRPLKLAVDPPSMAPARQAAFAWDCSSPSRALRADVRPLQSVCLRWVPRLSVSVHTVIRVQLPRPLAADDDLPAPHPFADHSPKTNDLTSGRFACYKVVWSSPGALAPSMVSWHADAAASLTPQATRRRRGGEKGLWNSLIPPDFVVGGMKA